METIKGVFAGIAKFAAFNIAFILFVAAAPLLYVTVPFAVVVTHPGENLWWLAMAYMVLGPLASAFWMLVICHYPTVHAARLAGKLDTWRADQGGLGHTLTKSFGFMFLGIFGSIVSEAIFCVAFHSLLVPPNAVKYLMFYVMAPFAVFAPVLVTLVVRRRRAAAKVKKHCEWREEYRQELLSKGMEVPKEFRAAHVNDANYTKFLSDLRAVWAQKDASFLRTAGVQA